MLKKIFNFDNVRPDIKDYVISILEKNSALHFKHFSFNSVKTFNIELIFGQNQNHLILLLILLFYFCIY